MKTDQLSEIRQSRLKYKTQKTENDLGETTT